MMYYKLDFQRNYLKNIVILDFTNVKVSVLSGMCFVTHHLFQKNLNIIPFPFILDIPSINIHQGYAAKAALRISESGGQKLIHVECALFQSKNLEKRNGRILTDWP